MIYTTSWPSRAWEDQCSRDAAAIPSLVRRNGLRFVTAGTRGAGVLASCSGAAGWRASEDSACWTLAVAGPSCPGGAVVVALAVAGMAPARRARPGGTAIFCVVKYLSRMFRAPLTSRSHVKSQLRWGQQKGRSCHFLSLCAACRTCHMFGWCSPRRPQAPCTTASAVPC